MKICSEQQEGTHQEEYSLNSLLQVTRDSKQVIDVSQKMFRNSPVTLDDDCNWVVFDGFLLPDEWQRANPGRTFVPMMIIFPDQYPDLPTNGFYLTASLNVPHDAAHFYNRGFGDAFGQNEDEMQAMADTNWKVIDWRKGDNLWSIIADLCIITVVEAVYPDISCYKRQGTASLKVSWEFMREVLTEADSRLDVDTVIDVHTHPFSKAGAWFSSVDDRDEETFAEYLNDKAPELHYSSIVFSQTNYQARYWSISRRGRAVHYPAFIKTQKVSESIPSSDEKRDSEESAIDEMFSRSILALGLDNMRRITSGQEITIAGVGGIGSIIAEHLVHMGFSRINLIDNGTLELTNLNRIEGVTYEDASAGKVKVDVIKRHLLSINPRAEVKAYNNSVFDSEVEAVIARSDWIMIAADNHASRYRIQELAFRHS